MMWWTSARFLTDTAGTMTLVQRVNKTRITDHKEKL